MDPRRRWLLTRLPAALLAGGVPLTAVAQPSGTMTAARIGYLTARALAIERRWSAAFREALRDLGYIEGRTITIDERHADGRLEMLPALAAELVRLRVDVLVATESFAAVEAKKTTTSIPIVCLTQDPVGLGLVASLARPGGNVTGVTDYHASMGAKRLQLLKELVPAASRVAVLFNSAIRPNVLQLNDLQTAARTLRLTLVPVEVKGGSDLDPAFASVRSAKSEGLVLLPGEAITSNQHRIAEFALQARIPAIYTVALWSEFGGLMSYGTDFFAYYRRAAVVVDKILKGARPADLPIEQPTKFELTINLKTAKAIGLSVPPSVLLRADRVIE